MPMDFRLMRPVARGATASAPSAPTGVTPTASAFEGAGRVSITWTLGASNGSPITNHQVQLSTNGGTTWGASTDTLSDGTSFVIDGLTFGTAYRVRVRAENAIGFSDWAVSTGSVTPIDVPAAPTSVSATTYASSGTGGMNVSWTLGATNGSALTNHQVQLSTNGGDTWGSTFNTSSGNNTATLGSLALNTSYLIRVRAQNAAGFSAWTISDNSFLTPTVPGAVPNVYGSTSTNNASAATITWDVPLSDGGSAITQYAIYYSLDGGTSWTLAATSSQPYELILPYRGGIQIVVDVKAINEAGTGPSASMYATPNLSDSPPSAPLALNLTAQSGANVYAEWDAPTYNGNQSISDYEIEYRAMAGSSTNQLTFGVDYYTFSPGVINLGTEWEARVRAINSVGNGEWSAWDSVIVADVPSDATMLTLTTHMSLQGAIQLDTVVPSANFSTITMLEVEYDGNGSFSTPSQLNIPVTASPSSSLTEPITGLTGGAFYYFRIRFVNALGASGWYTGSFNYATASNTVPDAVTGFTIAPDYTMSQELDATWSTPFDGGSSITQFDIYDDSDNVVTSPLGSATVSTNWTVMVAGDEYQYKIRAVNSVGNGPWSSLVPGKWKAVPATPTNVSATDVGSAAQVTWDNSTNDTQAGPLSYKVSYSTDSWTTQTDFPSVTSPYTISGLSSGSYDIRVTVTGDNFSGDPIYADTSVSIA